MKNTISMTFIDKPLLIILIMTSLVFNTKLVMAHAELQMLLALVGRSRDLEILIAGEVFGAEKALEMGLVNRVVPDDQVENEAYATAERIAEGACSSISRTRSTERPASFAMASAGRQVYLDRLIAARTRRCASSLGSRDSLRAGVRPFFWAGYSSAICSKLLPAH